jgi:hypothetical protein
VGIREDRLRKKGEKLLDGLLTDTSDPNMMVERKRCKCVVPVVHIVTETYEYCKCGGIIKEESEMARKIGDVVSEVNNDDDIFAMNEPSRIWIHQKSVMMGPGKSGKTAFWAQEPEKTFFFKTESGHNHVKHIGSECRDWNDIENTKNKLFKLAKTGKFPFETIVVDTGDRLLDAISQDVVERGQSKYEEFHQKVGINSIGDIPNGTGWFWRTCQINSFLKQLEELPAHIVLIFHVNTEELEDLLGKKYKKDTISIGGKSGKALLFWADHNIHIVQKASGESTIRRMYLKGTKNLEAGSRLNGMPDHQMWGNDMKANFKQFRDLFE